MRPPLITTSTKPIGTILDALRELRGGKGGELFRFIDEETLRPSNPLDALWVTGKGREVRLID
jgi:hypothetical protein